MTNPESVRVNRKKGLSRILGIDPGSIVTGYGIVEEEGGCLKHIADGIVSAEKSWPLSKRLALLFDDLQVIMDKYHPHAVAIEDIFFARNVKSAAILGHARGVAILAAARRGLGVFEYPPMKVKQAVVGYGLATKEQVQQMVKVLLKIEYLPVHDAADALAVAICHMNNF